MPRKKRTTPLSGAAQQQSQLASKHTIDVLFELAKFGWLTRHQIQQLLFQDAGPLLALRLLQRAEQERLVRSQPLPRSPGGQMLAWFLTRKGLRQVLAVPTLASQVHVKSVYPRDRKTGLYDLSDPKLHYHRHLCNELLINLKTGRVFSDITDVEIFPEHELSRQAGALRSHLGYVPDVIALYKDFFGEKKMLIGEVENSRRGPLKHGGKFTHWMSPFVDRVKRLSSFHGDFYLFGKALKYQDVAMIFLCADEKIFRNIYRVVNQIFTEHQLSADAISYLVMPARPWRDPLGKSDLLAHEYEPFADYSTSDFLDCDAQQRVRDGELKKRSYADISHKKG